MRLRLEASSSRESVNQQSEHGSDHLKTDAPQHLDLGHVSGSDRQSSSLSDSPRSTQHNTSPGSDHRYSHHSSSTAGSNSSPEARQTQDQTQADSALFNQLELLHQECQVKEALITRLEEQLAEWNELQAQLHEKDQLNRKYMEALQAAESTIAYLTACNLDSQGGFGTGPSLGSGSGSGGSDVVLQRRCMELQKALQKEEKLNSQLVECLNMAETAISSLSANSSSSDAPENRTDCHELCVRLEAALQQVNASLDGKGPEGVSEGAQGPDRELQRQADSLQEALWEQSRLNAELQEKLRAAEAVAAQQCHNTASIGQEGNCSRQTEGRSLEKDSKGQHGKMSSSGNKSGNSNLSQKEMTKRLSDCLSAAEVAIASLTAHCANPGTFTSGKSTTTNPDLQQQLDRLQRTLQQRAELGEPVEIEPTQQTTRASSHQPNTRAGTKGHPSPQELHHNLCLLLKAFGDHSQRMAELQTALEEERGRRKDSEAQGRADGSRGLPQDVCAQLESLQKALKEKKRACKSLEEKLATAQSIIALQNSAKKRSHGAAQKGNSY